MSSIDPNIEERIPGLQYPPVVDDATRNIFDNLFFLRRMVDSLSSTVSGGLTENQIRNLITQIVNNTTINLTSSPVIVTTHAIRLTMPATVGSLIFEYDRASLYVGSGSSGTVVWTWTAGNMIAALASRPADLTTLDRGFLFTSNDSDTETQYTWTGAEFITSGGYLQEVLDAATVTTRDVLLLSHLTSGVAGTLFGVGLKTQLHDSAGNRDDASRLRFEWSSAISGNEASQLVISLRNLGAALVDKLWLFATGALQITGNFMWLSSTLFAGILDHNNTANRVYTMPDDNGFIPYADAALPATQLVVGATATTNLKVKALGDVGTVHKVLHGNVAGDPAFSVVDLAADVGATIAPIANGGTNANNAAGALSNLGTDAVVVVGGDGAGTYNFSQTGMATDGSFTVNANGRITNVVAPT